MVAFVFAIMLMAQIVWMPGVAGLGVVGLAKAAESPKSFDDIIISLAAEDAHAPAAVNTITPLGTPENVQPDISKASKYPVIGESITQSGGNTETVFITSTRTITIFRMPAPTVFPDVASTFTNPTTASEFTQPTEDLASSTPAFVTSTQPTPSVCGEHGDFMLNFDGLPTYSGGGDGISSSYPPIFNPYRHFYFSGGWGYLHERNSPVIPQSSPHVAIYEPGENDSLSTGSPYAGLLAGGNFGAGPRAYDNAFWFNAKSFYFGCNNGSNDGPCVVTVRANRYSPTVNAEYLSLSKTFEIDACPDEDICVLRRVGIAEELEGLSSLGFEVTALDKPVTWYIDNIELSWFNNTCLAGMKRVSSR